MSFESHGEAVSIEHILTRLYNCNRFGFGGSIDADSIEQNPVEAYKIGLAPIYINADTIKRASIDNFINNLYQYENMKIEEIGVEVVQRLTEQFENLIR